jgi:hypothetical protein
MRRSLGAQLILMLALGAAAVSLGGETRANAAGAVATGCNPARVQYTRHPRVDAQLGRLPWVGGKPSRVGLVGLIWYWPTAWREQRVRTARIFAGGVAPAGYSTKILWTFVPRSGWAAGTSRLVLRGTQLNGGAKFSQDFGAISYSGQQGPAYASIVDIPERGCWRVELSAGTLRASVVFLAVSPDG